MVNRGSRRPAEAEDSEKPAAQEPLAQEAEAAEQPGEDSTPLGSWAEDAPGDKWEAGQQLAKNTSSYVLFAAGIAAVAVMAGWLAWQYGEEEAWICAGCAQSFRGLMKGWSALAAGAVRQSRLARAAAAVSVSTPAAQPAGQEDEGGPVATLQAPRTASGTAGGSQEGSNAAPAAEARAGQANESHVVQHPDKQQQRAAAAAEEQPEPAHGYKRPMRTPEGEAVLARIRAAQEERKAQQQVHKPSRAEGNGGAASSTGAAALGAAAGKAEGLAKEDSRSGSALSAVASQAAGGEGSGEESTPGEVAIPEGMGLDAVRRRADEASKAATASAAAAHSAATASLWAADASQAAAHYAQQAAAAATRWGDGGGGLCVCVCVCVCVWWWWGGGMTLRYPLAGSIHSASKDSGPCRHPSPQGPSRAESEGC